MAVLDFLTRKTRFNQALKEVKRIEDTLGRPLKIADVGCGSGVFSDILKERGHQVTGFDQHNCDLEEGIPAVRGEFDLAVSLAVAEHINNWELFLSELSRIADNVILTTPSVYGKPLLDMLGFLRLCDREHILDHKHYLTSQQLRQSGYDPSYFLCGLNQIALR